MSVQPTPSASIYIVAAVGALAGAAGVALAAAAAHRVESPALATAATMLMIHAVAVLSLVAIAQGATLQRAFLIVAALMLASVGLFSGDIALNTLAGRHLFAMAAPIGGSLLIGSWVVAAIVAAREALRSR